MSERLPEIVLVRHGETEWSRSGQHTGRTDIPLTVGGIAAAEALRPELSGRSFGQVWSSPSERARRTCEAVGYGAAMVVHPDLAEWDYGTYEGRTTKDILKERPGWTLFRDGCPDGEQAADVGRRADRMIAEARTVAGDLLIVSSSHFLRVFAARWLGLPPEGGAHFILGTASMSVLGYEHDATEPVIRRWNVALGSI